MLEKPMIIFTTFWDAVSLVDLGGIILDDKIIEFDRSEVNISSIALAQPKIPNQIAFPELDFFAPTWDLLKSYKSDKNWTSYTKDYKGLLKEYQKRVATWLNGLDKGKIHILCCWENTCNGANCHRRILFDLLSKSKRTKDIASYIYRDGDSKTLNKDKQLIAFKKTFNGELLEKSSNSNLNINEEIRMACSDNSLASFWGAIKIQETCYPLEVVDLVTCFRFKVFGLYNWQSDLDNVHSSSQYEIFIDTLGSPILSDCTLKAVRVSLARTSYENRHGHEWTGRQYVGFIVEKIQEL